VIFSLRLQSVKIKKQVVLSPASAMCGYIQKVGEMVDVAPKASATWTLNCR